MKRFLNPIVIILTTLFYCIITTGMRKLHTTLFMNFRMLTRLGAQSLCVRAGIPTAAERKEGQQHNPLAKYERQR